MKKKYLLTKKVQFWKKKKVLKIQEDKKSISEKDIRNLEYIKLSKNKNFKKHMNELKDAIYLHDWNHWALDNESMLFCEVNDICNLSANRSSISFTEKWKYFMSKFI